MFAATTALWNSADGMEGHLESFPGLACECVQVNKAVRVGRHELIQHKTLRTVKKTHLFTQSYFRGRIC
jgi:hypothetical protein